MQYTPQQLAGGVKFGSKVRIGNWKEDIELSEQKLKDFEVRRERGELLLTKTSTKLNIATKSVPLTYSADGNVHFGDYVLLGHAIGTLACNLWNTFNVQGDSVASIIPTAGPSARNTFQVVKSSKSGASDGVLRYGESFCLATNPSLSICPKTGYVKAPSYLYSELKTTMRQSKLSMKQEVCMSRVQSFNAEFVAQPLNPDNRLRLEGEPVKANEPVMIVHKATRTPLSCLEKYSFKTEFGAEYELYGGTEGALKKVYGLAAEKLGKRASDMVEKPPQSPNYFSFITASSPEQAADNRNLQPMTVETVLDIIKGTIVESKGTNAFRGLAKVFKILDVSRRGKLTTEEVKYGLTEYGISLDNDEYLLLFNGFATQGLVTYKDVMDSLRSAPCDFRSAIIQAAYSSVNRGTVTLRDIERAFNVKNHPSVLSASKSEKEILMEFINAWDTQRKDGVITWPEFYDYYSDVSAAIPDDGYFEYMMKNVWSL